DLSDPGAHESAAEDAHLLDFCHVCSFLRGAFYAARVQQGRLKPQVILFGLVSLLRPPRKAQEPIVGHATFDREPAGDGRMSHSACCDYCKLRSTRICPWPRSNGSRALPMRVPGR